MCNFHDVTWGTKGDNGSEKDLKGAKKVKYANGKEVMEVELPGVREVVDSLWQASRNAPRQKPPPEKEHRGWFSGRYRYESMLTVLIRCGDQAG